MWVNGRQGTGYLKKTLLSASFCDMHILKYPAGSFIPVHTDKVPGRRHYRLNILLQGEDNFSCPKVIFKWWRVCLFRPDLYEHSVEKCSYQRTVLSIGLAI